jgi:hypothetical protein
MYAVAHFVRSVEVVGHSDSCTLVPWIEISTELTAASKLLTECATKPHMNVPHPSITLIFTVHVPFNADGAL